MAVKKISRAICVTTVEDGVSQPSYIDVQEAWSAQATTASASTMPSDCTESSWKAYTPANTNNRAYLWRRTRTMTLNASTRQYTAGSWSYQRLNGTNGTSINTRGTVANASKRGTGTATLTDNTAITMSNGDCVVQQDNGHLYQWLTEGGDHWQDLGVFQGEPGKTYYTHIAWATGVTMSATELEIPEGQMTRPNATAVTGFTIAPTSQMPFMGVLVDENIADSTTATDYTWNSVKGEQGSGGVTYEIRSAIGTVKIAADTTTGTLTVTVYFYKLQDGALGAYSCYASAYRRKGTTYSRITRRTSKGTSMSISSAAVSSDANNANYADAVVVFMTDTSTGTASAAPSTYLAKLEIPVVKDGDTGGRGSNGRPGRFYYYAQEWQDSSLVSYEVTNAMAPYFKYGNNYYVFNPTEPGTYTMAAMGAPYSTVGGNTVYNENWEIMVNDFKYIITEAIFGAFAHFGGAIINGDYLLSQYVSALGFGNTRQRIQNATKFQYVDPDNMFGEGDMYEDTSDRDIFPLVQLRDDLYDLGTVIDVESDAYSESARSDQFQLLWGGNMYTLEMEAYSCGTDLEFDISYSSAANLEDSGYGRISGCGGTVKKMYQDDETYYKQFFFLTPPANGVPPTNLRMYFRLSEAGSGNYACVRNIYIRRVKFVPDFCLDLKSGKMALNNIEARGYLHAGSLGYRRAKEWSADGHSLLVGEESVVTIPRGSAGVTVILPEPAQKSEGHVIEIFNGMDPNDGWYMSYVGMTEQQTAGFLTPFSDNGMNMCFTRYATMYLDWQAGRPWGAYARTTELKGYTYAKLLCEKIGTNQYAWVIIKMDYVYRTGGRAYQLDPAIEV